MKCWLASYLNYAEVSRGCGGGDGGGGGNGDASIGDGGDTASAFTVLQLDSFVRTSVPDADCSSFVLLCVVMVVVLEEKMMVTVAMMVVVVVMMMMMMMMMMMRRMSLYTMHHFYVNTPTD